MFVQLLLVVCLTGVGHLEILTQEEHSFLCDIQFGSCEVCFIVVCMFVLLEFFW